jgi:uncharacterized protein YcnI
MTDTSSTSGATTPAATDSAHAEVLTGAHLQAVLSVLPPYAAGHVTRVVRIHLPVGATDEPMPNAWWSTSICENGHVVTYIGHEDPATATSVFDGSVTTTLACS